MNDFGFVRFLPPAEEKLKKFIKGYYVHFSDKVDFNSKVTFYQNITTTISIYKDSVTASEGRKRLQTFKKGTGFNALLVGNVDKFQEVIFIGPLDRLAIVFYPCGINHFIKTPLSNLMAEHYSEFNYFDDDFSDFLPIVYGTTEIEKKRDLLDEFFLSKLFDFPEKKLVDAVDILVKSKEAVKVSQLAEELNASRRTLLRLFKKHLSYSIEDYQSVIKFRKALYSFQNAHSNLNLTEIAYESTFYDQADFNRKMKFRSGLTPKELFTQLNIIDKTLFWNLN